MKKIIKFVLSTKGRVNRSMFTSSWIVLLLLCILWAQQNGGEILWFAPLALLPITVKRLHDINLNGFYSIIVYQVYGLIALQMNGMTELAIMNYTLPLSMLAYYMMWPTVIVLFYISIKKGHIGANRFGDDPSWESSPRVQLKEFLSWCGVTLKEGEKHK